MLSASDPQGDFAFLNLKAPAFDLTDRGVAGRPAPNGLDAFVYAERGVYRSGETAYLTALLRDAQGAAAVNVPLTLVVERPDGVEFKRALIEDQGLGGHTLALPINASAPTGTWHVRAFTDPKRPPVGETTFLVEDYVPDRIAFDLTSPAKSISPSAPAEVDVAGRFLYGAPAADLDLDGEVVVQTAKERPGFAGYEFGLADEELDPTRQALDDLPATDDAGNAKLSIALDKPPVSTHPLEAEITVRMAEPGGRAVEHKITLPVTPAGAMIGIKPLFSGRSLADGASANFDVAVVAPNGAALAQSGLHYQLLRIETHYQYYKRDGAWNFEPVKTTTRVADGTIAAATDKPGRISLPVNFGRYRIAVATSDPNGPETSVEFDAGWYVDANADTPDMLQVALDKPEYHPGDTMTVAVTARSAGRRHAGCHRRQAACEPDRRRQGRRRAIEASGRRQLGLRRLSGRHLAPSARCAGAADARPRHRRAMVRHRSRGKDADHRSDRAGLVAAEHQPACPDQGRRPRGRRRGEGGGRRRRCRHPQSDQLQAAVARRLLSRPARAVGGDPRPLRQSDRRHAGHARPDPLAAATKARHCRAVRRPGRRLRFIPALSRSARTAPPRWRSTCPTSPAPSASWRSPGAKTKSATAPPMSPCAIRSC